VSSLQALRVDAHVLQGTSGDRLQRFGIEEVAGVRKHAFEHYFDFAKAALT